MTGCAHLDWISEKSVPADLPAILARSGVALLRNAVPAPLAARSLSAIMRLFELPASIKQEHSAHRAHDPGFIANGRHRDRRNEKASLLESWNFHWAEGLPETIKPAAAAIHQLRRLLAGQALAVLGAIERHLDIAGGSLTGLVNSRSMALTLLHYPAALLVGSSGYERQFFHKDASFITLIPATSGSGLCLRDGKAIRACEPTGGDVLVLVGSCLEFVSDGIFRAREHGVVNPAANERRGDRYSSPLFISPSGSSRLTPLGGVASPDRTLSRTEFFDRYLPTRILADDR